MRRYAANHRAALAAELGIPAAHILVQSVNCTTHSGNTTLYALTLEEGGRHRHRALTASRAVASSSSRRFSTEAP